MHLENLPLCDVQSSPAKFAAAIARRGRAVVLTRDGKRTGVAMGIAYYEAMIEELETLRDVQTALTQVSQGKSISHAAASRRLRKRLDHAG